MGQIYTLSTQLTDIADLDWILQTVVDSAAATLPADWVTAVICEPLTQQITHQVKSRPDTTAAAAVLGADVQADAACSMLVVPLQYQGQTLGTLTAWNTPAAPEFTSAERELLKTLASPAAAAIANARLFAQTRTLAQTDGLTGVANRRMWEEEGDRLVAQARRTRQPFTLLLLDLDHFKQVNDTYGHAAGDAVLQAVVARCRAVLRVGDVLGRLGGEEFGVWLPMTSIDQALHAAERLREAIGATAVATASAAIPITVSIGLSGYDETSEDLGSLIGRADRALYTAKAAGRNAVAV